MILSMGWINHMSLFDRGTDVEFAQITKDWIRGYLALFQLAMFDSEMFSDHLFHLFYVC